MTKQAYSLIQRVNFFRKYALSFLSMQAVIDMESNILNIFEGLKSIDDTTKNAIRKPVKKLLYERIKANGLVLFISTLTLLLFLLFFLVCNNFLLSKVVTLITDELFLKRSKLYALYNGESVFVVIFLAFICLTLVMLFSFRKNIYGIISLTFFCLFADILIFFNSWDISAHYWINAIAATFLVIVFTGPLIFLLFYLISTYFGFLISWTDARYPLSTLVETFILVLNELESDIDVKALLLYKRKQLRRLERASKCIEKYLPRCLPSGDIDTDNWIKETTWQVAAAIREKKKCIVISTKNANDFLADTISFTLLCLIENDWDSLERVNKNKHSILPLRSLIINFALKALKIIVSLGLPLVSFWVFQKVPLVIPEIVRGYILVGLFLWEMFTLMVVIDPNLNAKISAIKDITGLLR